MERTTAWERDTITNVWSSTKTMMLLTLLELADEGELSLHDAVHQYWPEFKANGKEGSQGDNGCLSHGFLVPLGHITNSQIF
jgi:CubicO group peptidase (beta-lactamase class C family)